MGNPLTVVPTTQEQMVKNYLPTIKKSPVYQKQGQVNFYYPTPGETIETTLNGVLETTNITKKGDIVVVGVLGETYVMGGDKFNSRYEITEEPLPNGMNGTAIAKGKINAVKVGPENFEQEFIASWGEKMMPTIGGWYACGVNDSEVYFINETAFEKTYKQI